MFDRVQYWLFMFKRYKNVKGFYMRFFGIYINVTEQNASEKLLKLFHQSKKLQK